jgi:hypothetical protein
MSAEKNGKTPIRPEFVEAALRDRGLCGVSSEDFTQACILDLNHDGPHGWEQR